MTTKANLMNAFSKLGGQGAANNTFYDEAPLPDEAPPVVDLPPVVEAPPAAPEPVAEPVSVPEANPANEAPVEAPVAETPTDPEADAGVAADEPAMPVREQAADPNLWAAGMLDRFRAIPQEVAGFGPEARQQAEDLLASIAADQAARAQSGTQPTIEENMLANARGGDPGVLLATLSAAAISLKAREGAAPGRAPLTAGDRAEIRDAKRIVGNAKAEAHNSGLAIRALTASVSADGIVAPGDDDAVQTPTRALPAAQAAKYRIPPRPDLWPYYMSWPSARDMKLLSAPGVTDAQRDEVFQKLAKLPDYMMKRARSLEKWMEEEGEGAVFAKRGILSRNTEDRTLNSIKTDPFRQIHWAMLLDPMSHNPAVLTSVVSWSKMRARTRDNGEVLANGDAVSVTKISREAVALAIDEGIARGWKSHKLQGSPEFCKMAIEIARQRGIRAEVTIKSGLGLFPKTITVMPDVPAPDKNEVDEILKSAEGRQAMPKQAGEKLIAADPGGDPFDGQLPGKEEAEERRREEDDLDMGPR